MDNIQFKKQASVLLLAVTEVLTLLLVRAAGTEDVQMFLRWTGFAQQYGVIDPIES